MKNSSYHYKKPTKFKGQGKSGAAKIKRAAKKRRRKKNKRKRRRKKETRRWWNLAILLPM